MSASYLEASPSTCNQQMSPGISLLKKPTGLFMMSGWLLERSHTQLLVMYVLHQSFKLYSGSKRHGVLYMKICCIEEGEIARDAKTLIEEENLNSYSRR
uniref:Uncharacterized protein n=1 Tax=Amphimedon queenslandica TaxID=400682 RepID=A0A1X7VJM3_AMPQE